MKHCTVAAQCGGCAFLDIPYQEQLKNKRREVQALYPGCFVEETVGMEEPYYYRHKVYATFGLDSKGRLSAGLYQKNSHKPVFPSPCLIQNETANRIISDFCIIARRMRLQPYQEDRREGILRHLYLRVSHVTGKVMLVIVIGSRELPGSRKLTGELLKTHPEIETVILNWNSAKTSMILGEKEKILYGKGFIIDEIGGISFRISSRSFYQVNPVQTEKLYAKAIELAQLSDRSKVLDACCGIGTISLLAAKKAAEVIGVEIVPEAIRDAKQNARHNHLSNAEFYCDDANTFLDRLIDLPDVVFLDPPRSGMNRDFMISLAEKRIEKVVYISCNPVTQARDIKYLTERGYQIQTVVPFDLFPFTEHVETVVQLSKGNISTQNVRVEFSLEDMDMSRFQQGATYEQIQDWVQEKYGFHVSHLNIAQVKRKHGIIERENYNKAKSSDSRQPGCPEEKVKAIEAALRFFQMI